jgi:hypothetical protein
MVKLIKPYLMSLLSLIKSPFEIFSKRDVFIISFFTLIGIAGVFAAGLVTISTPQAQGAGYVAATFI